MHCTGAINIPQRLVGGAWDHMTTCACPAVHGTGSEGENETCPAEKLKQHFQDSNVPLMPAEASETNYVGSA